MESSLGQFLKRLERSGELLRIGRRVSPFLEITEIADRHSKSRAASVSKSARGFDPDHCEYGGKALLFEDVDGCDFPLVINVFGSYRRMEMALGCDDERGFGGIAERIGKLVKPSPPQSLKAALQMGREYLPLLRVGPKRKRGHGACQEVVKLTERGEVDLTRLPLIKCWPLDGDPSAVGYELTPEEAGTATGGGRYITFAGMHTIHADDAGEAKPASHNIGMYRAQLVDATRLAMHWHMHHDGASHWRSWKKAGKPMPIAIAFGGETVLPYAATCPLPPGISELLMAGFLNGRGIPMVRGITVPLWVPANSEIVIEGYVSTECGGIGFDPRYPPPTHGHGRNDLGSGAVFEGPFGDHTGFYSLPDRYPIVTVTAVTHRKHAVFPATVVGLPPHEDYYLGKATERIMLPLLKTIIPDVEDYHLPRFGCFHNAAFVQIRKAYPLHARRVMHAVWGAGQMSWTKLIVVVDESVNIHDEEAVLRAVTRFARFPDDLEVVEGPLDILDHAAPVLGAGAKMGIDATVKMEAEQSVRWGGWKGGVDSDHDGEMSEGGVIDSSHVETVVRESHAAVRSVLCPKWGEGRAVLVAIEKRAGGDSARVIEAVWNALERAGLAQSGSGRFIVMVDADVDVRGEHAKEWGGWEAVMFGIGANCDMARDIHLRDGQMAIDATAKIKGDERLGRPVRDWPPILRMSDDVRRKVNESAEAFGLSRAVIY